MKVFVDKFSSREWAEYSEQAHLICFSEIKPKEWDRIDFALVVRSEEKLMGYVTCREISADTVYWQFGGSFPDTKGTTKSWRCMNALVDFCREAKYKRITYLVENDNYAMLKMSMLMGFKIVGLRTFKDSVLLEHLREFEE